MELLGGNGWEGERNVRARVRCDKSMVGNLPNLSVQSRGRENETC